MSYIASQKPQFAWRRVLPLGALVLWLLVALFGPMLAQSHSYHAFVDQRAWGALPHAMDVLSNLGFLLAAAWGGLLLWQTRHAQISPVARLSAGVFFVGLACSFAGSSYYHWAPADASLVWDRLAMCVPFAGMLGLAAQQVCDDETALQAAAVMLVASVASVLIWQHSGNMLGWAVAQGGGMLALVVLAFVPRRKGGLHMQLGWVIGFYVIAKLLELGDSEVFHVSHELISGHSLKHLLAACAAWPVLLALREVRANDATALLANAGTMARRHRARG